MKFLLLSLLLCLDALTIRAKGTAVAEEYTVTILSDPPNDPFLVLTSVSFTCVVDPTPPDPVTYQWRVVRNSYGDQYNTQNISLSFRYYNLRFSWFYCHVFSNDTRVAVGSRQVEIQGIFSDPDNLVHHFTSGGLISLDVAENYYAARYVSDLTWYHNGSEIVGGGRIMISSDGRSINITDVQSSDAGIYQVKPTSLLIYRTHDPVCDSQLLPLLEMHSAFSPVSFTVKESSQCEIEYHNSSSFYPPVSEHYFTSQNDSSFFVEDYINFPLQLNLSLLLDQTNIYWLHNGESISSNGPKYNTSVSADNDRIRVTLAINNISTEDSGFFTLNLATYTLSLLYQSGVNCRNPYDYYDFLDYTLSIFQIHLGSLMFAVEKYRPPSVKLLLSHRTSEGSALVCSVSGGNPQSYQHNITLIRNNFVVSQTNGDHLVFNVSNMFGVYTCVVESLHSTDNKTLLIPERAEIQILVEINTNNECQQTLLEGADAVNSIRLSMMTAVETQCNCSLSVDNFEDSHLSCLGYGRHALFSSTLVYSDDQGGITASTLVGMLQSQLDKTDGQVLNLQGTIFAVPSACESTTCGEIIAGGFIGGWVVGLMTLALAIGVGACILKLKTHSTVSHRARENSNQQDNYVTSEDMKMASVEVQPNSAYEAVKIQRQGRSTNRQQETAMEEPVYEIPQP